MSERKIVDFHCHLGRWGFPRIDDLTDRYLKIMDLSGVDLACVNCIFFGNASIGNDIVASVVKESPDRFIPVAFVTPHYQDDVIGELERCFGELKAKFLKIYPTYYQRPVDDPGYEKIFKWCSDNKKVIMSHASEVFETNPPQLVDRYSNLADKFPGVSWVMAHGATGGRHKRDQIIEAVNKVPKVYIDTAGSLDTFGGFETLVSNVGAKKIVFGSDMPLFDARNQIARIITSKITEKEKKQILGENTIKLLGLKNAKK